MWNCVFKKVKNKINVVSLKNIKIFWVEVIFELGMVVVVGIMVGERVWGLDWLIEVIVVWYLLVE